jgi:hypothetical protein
MMFCRSPGQQQTSCGTVLRCCDVKWKDCPRKQSIKDPENAQQIGATKIIDDVNQGKQGNLAGVDTIRQRHQSMPEENRKKGMKYYSIRPKENCRLIAIEGS